MPMTISNTGLAFVKKFEGCHLYWYDLQDGGLTCGYGHYITYATAAAQGIKKGDKITQAQADAYLKADMQKFVSYTNSHVKTFGFEGKLNQHQFDALVSYCYNRGPGGLRQLLSNSKTVAEISTNLPIYWGSIVKYKKGLLNRRKAEQELFNTPVTNTVVKKDCRKLIELVAVQSAKKWRIISGDYKKREAAIAAMNEAVQQEYFEYGEEERHNSDANGYRYVTGYYNNVLEAIEAAMLALDADKINYAKIVGTLE